MYLVWYGNERKSDTHDIIFHGWFSGLFNFPPPIRCPHYVSQSKQYLLLIRFEIMFRYTFYTIKICLKSADEENIRE